MRTVGDSTRITHRLVLTDKKTGMRYLIDTGANVSVLPRCKGAGNVKPDEMKLYAVNGSPIRTYGIQQVIVDFGLRRRFSWMFMVADVKCAIIGADFLEHYKLLVDLANHKLLDGITNLFSRGRLISTVASSISTINQFAAYHQLLKEFIDITRTAPRKEGIHEVQHHIETRGAPVAERSRRLTPAKYKAAKLAIKKMIQDGICEPSSSQWASPIHLVPTRTGTWRLCGDYRRLNAITVPDRYPIPHIHDFAHFLRGCKVFSKLDLTRAFHQVSLAPEDRQKTAVTMPFGLFQFNVMTFGLCNAPQTFQHLIDTILRGLKFCHAYIDDIIIASPSREAHEHHLREVFERLRKYGLSINFSKCIFGADEVDYLGYHIDHHGTKPIEERVLAVKNFKKPDTIQELRRFFGIINFYCRFIPNAAQVQIPLYSYLVDAKKKDKRRILWTETAEIVFEQARQQLASAALLAHPKENAVLALSTDASDTSMGAVLEQLEDQSWRPLGYYSKKLSETQQKYSTYDRELLAIYSSSKYFQHLVEGQNLIIKTDHKSITYAFFQKSAKASPRQIRQLSFISQFTTQIVHVAGDRNEIADALSRVQAIDMPVVISTDDIAKEQEIDEELRIILSSSASSLQLRKLYLNDAQDTAIYCDVSEKDVRPFIPRTLRRQIFNTVHNLAHSSGRATRRLIARRFVWPGMQKDITKWVRTCLACQRSKIHRHVKTIPDKIAIPDEQTS